MSCCVYSVLPGQCCYLGLYQDEEYKRTGRCMHTNINLSNLSCLLTHTVCVAACVILCIYCLAWPALYCFCALFRGWGQHPQRLHVLYGPSAVGQTVQRVQGQQGQGETPRGELNICVCVWGGGGGGMGWRGVWVWLHAYVCV